MSDYETQPTYERNPAFTDAPTVATPTPTAPTASGVAPVLTIELPESGKSVVVLDKLPARLGRDEAADIHVDNAYLSRVHLEFRPGAQGVMVRDLSTKNRTLYNGVDLAGGEALLTDGAKLDLGPVKVSVSIPGAATARAGFPGLAIAAAAIVVVGFVAWVAVGAGNRGTQTGGGGEPAPAAQPDSLGEYIQSATLVMREVDEAVDGGRLYYAVDRLDDAREMAAQGREYAAMPAVQREWERLDAAERATVDAQLEELESLAESLDRRQRSVLDTYLTRLDDRFDSVSAALSEYENALDSFGVLASFDPDAGLDPAEFTPAALAQRRQMQERWAQIEGAAATGPAFAGLCPQGDCAQALALLERRVTLSDGDLAERIQALAQDWARIQRMRQRAAADVPAGGREGLTRWLGVAQHVEENRWEAEALAAQAADADRAEVRRRLAAVLADERFAAFPFYKQAAALREQLDAEDRERMQPWLERIDTALADDRWADAAADLHAAQEEFPDNGELAQLATRLDRQLDIAFERARVQEQLNPDAAIAMYRELYAAAPAGHALRARAADRLAVLGATP